MVILSSHYISILKGDQNCLDMVVSSSFIYLSMSGLLNTPNLYAQTILVLFRGYTQILHSEFWTLNNKTNNKYYPFFFFDNGI